MRGRAGLLCWLRVNFSPANHCLFFPQEHFEFILASLKDPNRLIYVTFNFEVCSVQCIGFASSVNFVQCSQKKMALALIF